MPTTWTPVTKTLNNPAGTGSPIGLLLALTKAGTATGTTWTAGTKASAPTWTPASKS